MGNCWNQIDEPVVLAGPKPLLTEVASHHSLESCGKSMVLSRQASFYQFGTCLLLCIRLGRGGTPNQKAFNAFEAPLIIHWMSDALATLEKCT